MDHGIDPFDRLGKVCSACEVAHLHEVEPVGMLRTGLDHEVALRGRACGATHSQASAEEDIDNMGTDEAGSPRDENILTV